MDISKFTQSFTDIVRRAEHADKDGLRLLRAEIIKILDRVGPKNFVTLTANILKNKPLDASPALGPGYLLGVILSGAFRIRGLKAAVLAPSKDKFCIEGCNDARLPLKRIFTVSPDELERLLYEKDYGLDKEHPLSILAADHKSNVLKLKTLNSDLQNIKEGCSNEYLIEALGEVKDYYLELDIHIKKEEEVFFPVLEKQGMEEHPDVLREEHKRFRDILSELAGLDATTALGEPNQMVEKIEDLKDRFIPEICNHIFRETYVFYPAALEFIAENKQWDTIKEGFKAIE